MTLDFSTPGEVKITMYAYMEEIANDFEKETGDTGKAATPAAEFLFKIDKDAVKLQEEIGKIFHNFVAKCLFATK